MKYRVTRAIKNHSFLAPKNNTGTVLNFPLPKKIVWGRVPPIPLPLFFKECLNAHIRINKMKSKHIASYQPSPSGLTSMYTFFALFLSRILLSFKSKLCIFHHSWETVSNLLCSCYWNSKKKLEVDIFSHTPTLPGKILLQVLIIIFLKIYFILQQKVGGE